MLTQEKHWLTYMPCYIGDSDVDLATAANANIDCIAVTWGFRDEEFLVKNGAKIIAHNPDDVRRILL